MSFVVGPLHGPLLKRILLVFNVPPDGINPVVSKAMRGRDVAVTAQEKGSKTSRQTVDS
ncbi:hypothetical protein E4U43_001559 [Claviceps pusilla]|uniref:Uncharacterized protein n=1 Tax=Claviceps pusilla TaxID=123648 RepID=A0A9P7N8C1_9HYPO|nr:hypothetical protein E4U43_001559 [Claviceps pusilla]